MKQKRKEHTRTRSGTICIGCGCTDNHACVNEWHEPCHWLKVDHRAGLGVCSACPSFLNHPLTHSMTEVPE